MSYINQFDFDSEKDSLKCMAMAVRWMRQARDANTGFSGFIIREARKFNVPGGNAAKGALAADEFKVHMQKLVNELITRQQELCGFTLTPTDLRDLKLDGNGALANAVKRVCNAMSYGGDLDNDECATVSKCASFAAKARKTKEAEDTAAKRREGAELKAEALGLERGTDAFNKKVDELLDLKLQPVQTDSGASDAAALFSPEPDEIGQLLLAIEQEAREVAKLYSITDVLQQLTVYKDKLHNRVLAKAAKDTGLIKPDSDDKKAAA